MLFLRSQKAQNLVSWPYERILRIRKAVVPHYQDLENILRTSKLEVFLIPSEINRKVSNLI